MASGELTDMIEFIRTVVADAFPGLAGGLLAPVRARVVHLHAGGADLRLLRPDGSDDDGSTILPMVAVPKSLILNTGDLVRVGFYYGDRGSPFIDGLA